MPPARGNTSPTNCIFTPCRARTRAALAFTRGERERTSNEPSICPCLPLHPRCRGTYHCARHITCLHRTHACQWSSAINQPCGLTGSSLRSCTPGLSHLHGASCGQSARAICALSARYLRAICTLSARYLRALSARAIRARYICALSARALQPARNHQLQLRHLCRLRAAISVRRSLGRMSKRLVRKLHANGALLLAGDRS